MSRRTLAFAFATVTTTVALAVSGCASSKAAKSTAAGPPAAGATGSAVAVANAGTAAASAASSPALSAAASGVTSGAPIEFGVSAPLTGPDAEYGAYFKQGFGLALDQINGSGGVDGRKIELEWEDTQSDPKQSVPVAQKFASDKNIIAELGDFSSTASMAASPVYERNKLVQYGYTNSSPLFTLGGNYMWTSSVSQSESEVQQVDALAKYGKNVAVLYLNTSWGQGVYSIFQQEAKKDGLNVTYSGSYLATTTDFRPLLIKARDSKPDVTYDIGYDPDGAAILNQSKDVGLTSKVFLEQLTAAGIKLAGKNAEGALTTSSWFPNSRNPTVQAFTKAFEAKYGNLPGQFEVIAYDALYQLAYAVKVGGPTRQGVYNGLLKGAAFPSVEIGTFQFQSDRRPKAPPAPTTVVVKNGVQVPVTS